jgi:catalase
MVPLVIAPRGGELDGGIAVQRTFATGRSVEYDAVVLAGFPGPAADAVTARDAKAGAAATTALDPRVRLLVEEAYRHAKLIAAYGAGVDALTASGCPAGVGVVSGEDPQEVLAALLEQLGEHRVWQRFPASIG